MGQDLGFSAFLAFLSLPVRAFSANPATAGPAVPPRHPSQAFSSAPDSSAKEQLLGFLHFCLQCLLLPKHQLSLWKGLKALPPRVSGPEARLSGTKLSIRVQAGTLMRCCHRVGHPGSKRETGYLNPRKQVRGRQVNQENMTPTRLWVRRSVLTSDLMHSVLWLSPGSDEETKS